jgi:hypothetical protein
MGIYKKNVEYWYNNVMKIFDFVISFCVYLVSWMMYGENWLTSILFLFSGIFKGKI